jgi:ABC-2 type transport system ATP-binding protein
VKLDDGAIRLFGRRLTPQDPRPEVGVVPQELAVYPRLTATENLEVFGRLNGVSRAALRDRVQWALEWSDLKDRARDPVLGFSGGMKRRLNIACSLVHKPTVVLLDEPTVGVDPQSRERIYEMLADLQKSGVSIVLTTHHLEEAERRCERIVIIDHGKAVATGTVRELLGAHAGAARTASVLFDDGRSIRVPISNIGPDLAALLAQLSRAGTPIADLQLEGRSLQDVFIALTGRELRD